MSELIAGKVIVPVEPDAGDFGKKLGDQIANSSQDITRRIGRIGLVLGAAVAAGVWKSIDAASQLQETLTAVTFAFGKSADQVLEWSKNQNDAFSRIEFNRAAKGFATFGNAANLSDKDTAQFSKTLIDAAQDLASFHDANTSDALQDMQSALTGLYRPLRKYAIVLSDAGLTQFALNKGIIEGKEKLTDQQKILVRQQYIIENLGEAQGDWARTINNVANQERLLKANAVDLSSQLGTSLLPTYNKIIGALLKFVNLMGRHQMAVKVVTGAIALLAAGMLAYAFAAKAAAAATVIMTIATKGLNAATKATIWGAVAVAILYLVTALVIAYQTSEKFRGIVSKAFTLAAKAVGYFLKWIYLLVKVWSRAIVLILKGLGYIPGWGDKFDGAADAINRTVESINDLANSLIGSEVHLGKVSTSVKTMGDAATGAKEKIGRLESAIVALQEKLAKMGEGTGAVFDVFSTKAMSAFDAETARVLENLQVRVEALGRSWVMKASDKTPAERELEAFDKLQAAKDLADKKADLRKQLKEAGKSIDIEQEIGGKIISIVQTPDADEVKRIKGEIKDVNRDIFRTKLQARAAAERTAAAASIASAQKEYQARRDLQKEHFQKELAALQKSVAKGLLTQKQYRNKALALLAKYGVELGEAGRDLGQAFSAGLIESMQAVEDQAKKTHAILQKMLNLRNKIIQAVMLPPAKSFTSDNKGGRSGKFITGGGFVGGNVVTDKGTMIVGQQVQNQYVMDDHTARTIGNQAARKATRQVKK